jgi:glycosyltransferase 2 family protein
LVTIDKIRGKLVLSLVLGAVVFVGLSLYADVGDVVDGLGRFKWQYLPLVLALTSINYVLRFFKWQYYLRTIGVEGFPRGHSALAYLAGLGMVVTPGKVGEWLKCYLLRELHGTPFTRSAPILIAERLTDCLAMVLLGSVGLFVYRDSWPVFVFVVVGGLAALYVARNRKLAFWILRKLEGLPVVSRFAKQAEEFYESSYTLLSPTSMLSMTILSFISWGFEVLAFYVVLIGMGQDGGGDLLLKASFIMPAATLASAVLLTPGGLGVAEGGITGLCQVLLDMPKGDAAVATLLIRFGTLWFGVIVGLVALALVSRVLARKRRMPLEASDDLPIDLPADEVEDPAYDSVDDEEAIQTRNR